MDESKRGALLVTALALGSVFGVPIFSLEDHACTETATCSARSYCRLWGLAQATPCV